MFFIGVDPGRGGAIAAVDGAGMNYYCLLSVTERDISDWMAALPAPACIAMIERVHAMPKQGVSSTFKFGQNYGFVRGLLIAHRIAFSGVTPQTWQKAMGCLSRGDKNVTKARAQQLFPRVKVTHAIADALLIAEYCRRTHGNPGL